jgi:diaminopropionate ammonia-lyase
VSGETGAAGLGGLLEILRTGGAEARRTLGIGDETRVLIFNCEGATDPDAYRRVMAG